MKQFLSMVTILVREYDEAIDYFVKILGFALLEDTAILEQGKRWVVISPPGSTETRLLLARATDGEQSSRIGNQTGGRVFLFLCTDDFWRDYYEFQRRGVVFIREPVVESYGTVAVFQDLYGNQWDLLQRSESSDDGHGN
jgi:catechol 2,3-dioxygenase-like lactoylglutathione lyase family enzyme